MDDAEASEGVRGAAWRARSSLGEGLREGVAGEPEELIHPNLPPAEEEGPPGAGLIPLCFECTRVCVWKKKKPFNSTSEGSRGEKGV